MKAIIIEDEPKAIALLEGYLTHFNSIELVGSFRNGLKAFEFIKQEEVDLIFLDINMPHLSGLSLSKMIPKDIRIIFTTAHAEHAVESYEVHTLDYLLKPISLERFTQAMAKVLETSEVLDKKQVDTLLLKSGNRVYRVVIDEIWYLQKEGNYMTYHLGEKKILCRESVAESLESLPNNFIQCHKSYIVNISHIRFFDKEEISIDSNRIPIGKAYKAKFLQAMKE